ncbi:chitin binding domain-containing protein [Elizabethkingia anophelis]|uniref:chitin binding peritrophin-A domain-containing protein n=1 Tax=Elizabethkingia anophelis TaxID=1117645 RepID=UPI0038921478|nr:chitin binding domain-containing protein [Elizabethkingia anophelis]MCT3722904.1 chitin binding domain-containing protein [Elizabethkingia anophelis]MCT3734060.1 chitin binding domain-containing protein [Elizabethkingia anophelis]MCT3754749.1 chitin binding domain-containing protein [Elizabethkingia anophelis]MCT3776044.1 chitin binding domain-containing protein [Elizabethkingia anophelis]
MKIRCVAAGFYPYPNVGDKYLQCVQISGQWYYYVYSCPANSNFNPSVGRCVVGYVP